MLREGFVRLTRREKGQDDFRNPGANADGAEVAYFLLLKPPARWRILSIAT